MIFFEGLDSIIESAYIHDSLGNRAGESDIYVNPANTKYLTGKTVIISSSVYPVSRVEELVQNSCEVISRVSTNVPGVIFQPYILRFELLVGWNGREIEWNEELTPSILLRDYCTYDTRTWSLYFPKLLADSYDIPPFKDKDGNLESVGWVSQQVGINVKTDTVFLDLDMLKTKKVKF